MKSIKFTYTFLLMILLLTCKENKTNNDLTLNDVTTLDYTHEVVVPDLVIPWGIAFLPDNSMLITEKEGKLIHFKNNKKTEIKDLPEVEVQGQGGLMDVELHPNYKENGWIYIWWVGT